MKKSASGTNRKLEDQLWTLQAYTSDIISCLWSEQLLSQRQSGMVFSKLPPRLVEQLSKSVPNVDGALGLRSHVAFAPYTYTQVEGLDCRDMDTRTWFENVVEPEFANVGKFFKAAVPELRG